MRLSEIITLSLTFQACAPTIPEMKHRTPTPRIYFPSVTIDQATHAHAEAAREVPPTPPEDIRTVISEALLHALEGEDISPEERFLAIDYVEQKGDEEWEKAKTVEDKEKKYHLSLSFKYYELAYVILTKKREELDREWHKIVQQEMLRAERMAHDLPPPREEREVIEFLRATRMRLARLGEKFHMLTEEIRRIMAE